jgi:hypothetical protein
MHKFVSLGAGAALLATSLVGIPGLPNTPLGVSEAHADGYYRRHHHRHRDNFDLGDAVVGAVVVGGLIAVLSSASKKKRDETDRPLDSGWEPRGDWNRGAEGDWRWADREWDRRTNEERAAVSVCAREAEELGGRYEREARLSEIETVDRSGGEYRVRGRLDVRARGGLDDRRDSARAPETDAFTCYVRNDRIVDFRFEAGYAAR